MDCNLPGSLAIQVLQQYTAVCCTPRDLQKGGALQAVVPRVAESGPSAIISHSAPGGEDRMKMIKGVKTSLRKDKTAKHQTHSNMVTNRGNFSQFKTIMIDILRLFNKETTFKQMNNVNCKLLKKNFENYDASKVQRQTSSLTAQ